MSNSNLLLDIYSYIKKGENPSTISKNLNISKQRINYYISSLKNKGLIKKIGYGTWQVKEVKKSTKDTIQKEVRGHAFIWKIKVPKEIKGYNKEKNINHLKPKFIGIKRTPRIIINNKKIWLGNKNIIIYDSNSYLGNNAIESRKLAVYRLMTIIQELENKLTISLKTKIGYIFKPKREHYSLIKNDLAIQCNKEGKKINIKFHGETWFIIDNSYNLDEAETIHKETALTDNIGLQKYFNELKETKYEVTPKFILNVMNGIQQNQLIFDKNMSSHLAVLGDLRSAIEELRKEIKKQNIKSDNTYNKSLFDY